MSLAVFSDGRIVYDVSLLQPSDKDKCLIVDKLPSVDVPEGFIAQFYANLKEQKIEVNFIQVENTEPENTENDIEEQTGMSLYIAEKIMQLDALGISLPDEKRIEASQVFAKVIEIPSPSDNAEWADKTYYSEETLVMYEGKRYMCITSHISNKASNWVPSVAHSLWVEHKEDFEEWSRPTGAHDAYMDGDKVIYKGIKYISTINGNVWPPDEYPQGWKAIEE